MRATHLLVWILTAVVMPALVLPKIAGASDNRNWRSDRAVSEASTFKGLLDRFHLDCGRYPTTQEGLTALHDEPPSLKGRWAGPYSDKTVFDDPWGHPYFYRANGKDDYTFVSYGADGQPGGEGEDADLDNRDR